MLVLRIYITAIGANAPRVGLSLRIVNVIFKIAVSCALGEYEVEASEVLGLVAGCFGNLNGVLTGLKGYLNAVHIRTDELIVVTGGECLGVICPTVRGLEGVFAFFAFVYVELSATNLGVLQTNVNCHFVYACLLYGYGVNERFACSLGDVVVLVGQRIGISAGACFYFIIFGVLVGLVFPCGNEYYVFALELFGKSCCKLVYLVVAVAVYVEGRSYVLRDEGVVAVCALAVYNLVLVVRIYITAIGANAPSVVLSLFVVNVVVEIAVNIGSLVNLCGSRDNGITNGALNAGGSTICITGGSNCGNFYFGVAESSDLFGLGFVAFASKGLNACGGASSCGGYFAFAPYVNVVIGIDTLANGANAFNIVVCYNSNFLLLNNGSAALGTFLTFGKTCFGTGCCYCGNNLFGMSGCRNSSGFLFAAFAGAFLRTGFGTGSCLCYCPVAISVNMLFGLCKNNAQNNACNCNSGNGCNDDPSLERNALEEGHHGFSQCFEFFHKLLLFCVLARRLLVL